MCAAKSNHLRGFSNIQSHINKIKVTIKGKGYIYSKTESVSE